MSEIRLPYKRLLTTGHIAALLALLPSSLLAAPFTFDNIADTRNGFFATFSQAPTISSSGIVAFHASLVGGEQGIFTGSGGPTTTIADSSGVFRTFSAHPSVNASGTVAFRAQLDTLNTGIFINNSGLVTTLASDLPNAPIRLASLSEPTINNQGAVAFIADVPSTIGNRIFLSQGGTLTTLYDTSGPFNTFLGTPFINNQGFVVFVAGLDAGGTGVFAGNGGTPIEIADSSGPFSTFGVNPTISDTGIVAFLGRFDSGGQGIFTGDGTQIVPFVNSNDPLFLGAFTDPSINSQGTIAYGAQTECSGGEILAGPDPIADRVVGTTGRLCPATVLFGDPVIRVEFLQGGVNDLNQIAGNAVLSHGGEVVFRANPPGPADVPEPATLMLFAIGLASWRLASRVRRPTSTG